MKIAVVHDWLVTYAGAERVLEQILHCYPQADLYCVVDFLPEENRAFLGGKRPKPTWVQHLPFAEKKYRTYLPFMPWAVQSLDLRGYDLILSSSHAVAKGVKTTPNQIHISYIHSPMRYAWDLQDQYLRESGLDVGIRSKGVRWLLKKMREWDKKNTARVQYLIANSQYIAHRIHNCYQRDASVIYPPVSVDDFSIAGPKEDFFVTVSRLVPYKKVDLIAEAFGEMPDKQLLIIGDGPDFQKVKSKGGENVHLLGALPFGEMKKYLQRAKAFVFAAEEDFGISVVEAQACGTPVIAFGKGGALETVRGVGAEKPSGIFFTEQTVDSLTAAVRYFESQVETWTPQNCRDNAQQFSVERFRSEYRSFVESKVAGGPLGPQPAIAGKA